MTDPDRGPELISLMRELAATDGRHLAVEGTLNFRDIGGYPVAGGGTTAWRTLFRSDALHRLDPAGQAALAELELASVIDLRIDQEREFAPTPLDDFASRGTATIAYSLVGADFSELPEALAGVYSYLVTRRGPAIGAVIKELARPGAMPALVHCTAGKDRTGVVVAFTLAAMGVPDEVIAADYALSGAYLMPGQTAVIGQISAVLDADKPLIDELLASPPELIIGALDLARSQAGSIPQYLARNGVTEADVNALRAALVTPE
jgi:protein-tyrosine phosphatase